MRRAFKRWVDSKVASWIESRGYQKLPFNDGDGFLGNVFGTDHERSVLISYITSPFIGDGAKNRTHTNYMECYTAAEIFRELGYKVDVVHCSYPRPVDYAPYSVVYGFGAAMENLYYSDHAERITKIIYGTGCCTFYSAPASVRRVWEFRRKNGFFAMGSARVGGIDPASVILADAVIALGNAFVASTFQAMNPATRVEHIPAFYYDVCDLDPAAKDYAAARRHFLWFGSAGCIHKGLDIAIDHFAAQDGLHLHICGYAHAETRFWDHYRPIIESRANLHYHGFVDIRSEQFRRILDTCACAVYPSVSEGGSPSVLNVVANGGLIPIISESSGVDIEPGAGWLIDEVSTAGLARAVAKASAADDDTLREMACTAHRTFRERYSYENYRSGMRDLIGRLAGGGPAADTSCQSGRIPRQ